LILADQVWNDQASNMDTFIGSQLAVWVSLAISSGIVSYRLQVRFRSLLNLFVPASSIVFAPY